MKCYFMKMSYLIISYIIFNLHLFSFLARMTIFIHRLIDDKHVFISELLAYAFSKICIEIFVFYLLIRFLKCIHINS